MNDRRPYLYFAYGSNLNLQQMIRRCPKCRPLSSIRLKGWRLVFRGIADIEKNPRACIYGALYSITAECERALDKYEGYPTLYRKRFIFLTVEGKVRRVMFYQMVDRTETARPSPGYADCIRYGFKDWSLPIKNLYKAIGRANRNGNGKGRGARKPVQRLTRRPITTTFKLGDVWF